MEIANLEHHTMCECGNCYKVIIVDGNGGDALNKIDDKLNEHLEQNVECKKWYNELPTLNEWLVQYHASHNCNPGPCECKCGCTVQLGCKVMSPFCSKCHLAIVRYDDDEHGYRE